MHIWRRHCGTIYNDIDSPELSQEYIFIHFYTIIGYI